MKNRMTSLNFPPYEILVREEQGKELVFDPVRKQWVVLFPEEWVRQHVICFLREQKHYPVGLIAVEKGFTFQGKPWRADLIIHDNQGQPVLLVECKAPEVQIDQKVFDQVARYNQVIRAEYLYVTNGLQHFCSRIDWDNKSYEFITAVPAYTTI